MVTRSYSCLQKYRDGWKTLIDQHMKAGRIWLSSSPYASPSFVISKADSSVLPCWINDYQHLNACTVPNNFPLLQIDDILADCIRLRTCFWRKIDLINTFFQILVHSNDIKYTAMLTPFGLLEWVVMPMGLKNAPADQQWCVTLALYEYIEKILPCLS